MATFVAGNIRLTSSRLCKLTTVVSSPQMSKKVLTKCFRLLATQRPTTNYQLCMANFTPDIGGKRGISKISNDPETHNTCWNCKTDLSLNENLLFCKKCNALRAPPEDMNYFDLFGLEMTFSMDLKELADKHKSMQRELHPDKFTKSSEDERTLSETWSPLVNEAYACLKKPVRRANYLLALAGRPLKEGENLILDANFLAEVFELNDEINEAEGQTDVAGLMAHVREVLQTYYDRVEVAFDTNNIERARLITAQMRYYENLKKKLAEREMVR